MKNAEPMDWPAIIAEVHRRGMTLVELAERNGLPSSSTRRLKSQTHYKAQAILADFLGMKPEELFPNRYPIRKPRILDTKKYPPVKSQKLTLGADKRDAA